MIKLWIEHTYIALLKIMDGTDIRLGDRQDIRRVRMLNFISGRIYGRIPDIQPDIQPDARYTGEYWIYSRTHDIQPYT